MELICISLFSITRAGVTTVYPKHTDHVIALRQNNVLLSPNLFSIHGDKSHVTELNHYDAVGTVLMKITDELQYKRVLEKLYVRVLVFGAEFDHQPKFGKTYDTTLILKTRAPLSVILDAAAVIAESSAVGSVVSSSSPQNIRMIDGSDSVDDSATTVGDVAYGLDHMRENIDVAIRDMTGRQSSIETTVMALKDAVNNLAAAIQSLDRNVHNIEDRCDIIDGHISIIDAHTRSPKPFAFGSMSDAGSSVSEDLGMLPNRSAAHRYGGGSQSGGLADPPAARSAALASQTSFSILSRISMQPPVAAAACVSDPPRQHVQSAPSPSPSPDCSIMSVSRPVSPDYSIQSVSRPVSPAPADAALIHSQAVPDASSVELLAGAGAGAAPVPDASSVELLAAPAPALAPDAGGVELLSGAAPVPDAGSAEVLAAPAPDTSGVELLAAPAPVSDASGVELLAAALGASADVYRGGAVHI